MRASARPLVVLTREPVPGSGERARLDVLLGERPDAVVLHTGFPGAVGQWFGATPGADADGTPAGGGTSPGAGPTVVVACGTGRANARAAVALLRGAAADGVAPATGEGER